MMRALDFLKNTAFGWVLLFVIIIVSANQVQAVGSTYTICDSGCDFTTLTSAVASPGLGTLESDTLQLTADYVYAGEFFFLSVPDNVTVECVVGAETFGDFGMATQINLGSNVTIQNCVFENADFTAVSEVNVNLITNTFSEASSGEVTLTDSDGFDISDNIDIQRVVIQNSDNGVIDNNSFECRFNDTCISVTTSSGSPDYTNPADIPSSVDITNNTITNYRTATIGDFVSLDAGENINFTGNTIKSAVDLDNNFAGLLTVQNAEVYIAGNYFLFPFKIDTYSGTWGVNIRVTEADVTVVAEHNTFILNGTGSMLDGSACFGVFDDQTSPVPTIDLEVNYNLCYNPWQVAGGTGVVLNYNPSTITMVFNDSYNGFYNLETLINDSNAIITSLDGTTITTDPVLRTENVDASDDYDPVPMSRYLDVNGTNDIGALSVVRAIDYLINDDCVVDYTSCVSITTDILNKVIKSGDAVEIAAGTYQPLTLDGPLDDITIQGAGSTTIFDAGGVGSAVTLDDISNSNISNIKLQDSVAPTITTYEISRAQYTDSVTTYDQFGNLGTPNGVFIIKGPPIFPDGCDADVIDNDGADVTDAVGAASDNWNLALIDYLGNKLTVFAPNNYITSAVDLEGCSDPGDITVEYFIEDIFTVSGGVFTYNQSVADLAGVSVKLGDTDPPTLDQLTAGATSAGLKLTGVADTIFDEISFDNNTVDVISDGTGTNALQNSTFDIGKLQVDGTGDLEIYYSVQATVERESNSDPINGASVEIANDQGVVVDTIVTDSSGVTTFSDPILATVLGQGDPLQVTSGGLNPFSFIASKSGFRDETVLGTINTPFQNFDITLDSSGGGGSSGQVHILPAPTPIVETPTPPLIVETPIPQIIPEAPTAPAGDQPCPAIPVSPIRFGAQNDPANVMKLEQFLNTYEGQHVPVDGFYSIDDRNIVIIWQEKYTKDILTPWGLTKGTGFIYSTSLKKIREIAAISCPDTPKIYQFLRTLKKGLIGGDVAKLQVFLNTHGALLGATGAGSPGNETNFFGNRTFNALIKFQNLHAKSILIPIGLTFGTGLFGDSTRKFVNDLLLRGE